MVSANAVSTVMVTATDPSGETATVMVTIKVTNVDEAPTIMVGGLAVTGGQRSINYPENGTGIVDTYGAVGPDAARCYGWDLYQHRGRHVGQLHPGGGGREYVPPGDGDVHRRASPTRASAWCRLTP